MGVRGKKLTALLGVAVMTASLLSGCGSASETVKVRQIRRQRRRTQLLQKTRRTPGIL